MSRSFHARPTTDFGREGLFSIIGSHFDFESLDVLDLFAGTGSISFEFASRGSRKVDAVERDHEAVRNISLTVRAFEMKGVRAVCMEAFHYIRLCHDRYHIVFADPPYDMKNLSDIPDCVFERGILLPGGWHILEHGREHCFSNHPCFFDERRYGHVHFSFFRNATSP